MENLDHGIVHRLDKNTTGALVIAKNNYAHNNIAKQIQDRETKKIYIALVRGIIKEENGVIKMPIGRHPTDRKKMAVLRPDQGRAREALTYWRVKERYSGATLVECELKTGRTHQIRVHMAHIGHPIIGDALYYENDKYINRQALHCCKMDMGEFGCFKAPLPSDILELVKRYFKDENIDF